ncbi:MAG: glycosyltransferase family 1 protein [Armatimonadetes bacterium]|nr:glycosyltransferase family 1 protein [Armatimonadota bacterium]
MRIGIDGRVLSGRYTGDRTYWRNLLRSFVEAMAEGWPEQHEFVVYTRLPIPAGELPEAPCLTQRCLPASNDRLWTMLTFPRALRQDNIDLAHTQYTIPMSRPCKMVTTVHDISFRLYPEWFPRKHRMLMNLTVPPSMRHADAVITVSESSQRDILRVFGFATDKVVAIPLAAGPEYQPGDREVARAAAATLGVTKPYIISVGVLQPRKNVPLLVEAFARAIRQAGKTHQLLLVGKKGWQSERVDRLISRLDLNDSVALAGYVPDEALPDLYRAADAMAFTSLYEGFGLPPLEAMACGTPTLVSEAPAMPEVAGNGAWVLPAMDAAAWGDALASVMASQDLRDKLSAAGLSRAAELTWSETGASTLSLYEEVAGGAA